MDKDYLKALIKTGGECIFDSSAGTKTFTTICREKRVINSFFRFKNLCGNKRCHNIFHHRLEVDVKRANKSETQINAKELAEVLEPYWMKALSMNLRDFVKWYNNEVAQFEYEKIKEGELKEAYKFMK